MHIKSDIAHILFKLYTLLRLIIKLINSPLTNYKAFKITNAPNFYIIYIVLRGFVI